MITQYARDHSHEFMSIVDLSASFHGARLDKFEHARCMTRPSLVPRPLIEGLVTIARACVNFHSNRAKGHLGALCYIHVYQGSDVFAWFLTACLWKVTVLPVVRVQSACFSLLLTNFNVVLPIIFAHARAIVTSPSILSKAWERG